METNFIWKERKRNALGLPWTFTKYALTGDRLFITSGLLKTVEDEVRLYRILDISLSQTLTQKIFRIGTIQVSSADKTLGNFEIKNIKDPRQVKEQLSQLVEENREKKRVTNREFMGEDSDFDDGDDQYDACRYDTDTKKVKKLFSYTGRVCYTRNSDVAVLGRSASICRYQTLQLLI